jgi:hypothetical protein
MPLKGTKYDEIIQRAKKGLQEDMDACKHNREESAKDLRYLSLKQWDEAEIQSRMGSAGSPERPALVADELNPFVDQVVNEFTKNKPGAKVAPVSEGATDDDADVIGGLLRHIDYASRAKMAYGTAFRYEVASAEGFTILNTQWVDGTFNQEIVVEPVEDPSLVFIDAWAKWPDGSDANRAFQLRWMSQESYKETYGDQAFGAVTSISSPGAWISANGILMASFWERTKNTHKLHQVRMTGGAPIVISEQERIDHEIADEDILQTREEDDYTVMQYIIDGAHVHKETEWLGSWIPITRWFGKEYYVDGKKQTLSLIRPGRDPQKLKNYYRSLEAEVVSLGSRSPFLGYTGQFKDRKWRDANSQNYAYLEAEAVSENGELLPLPQRQTAEPPVQALIAGAQQSIQDIRQGIGMYPPSLGQPQSADQSGKAILALQQEGDNGSYLYFNNAAMSQWHQYRMMLELIQEIYTEEQEIRILGPDMKQEIVKINTQDPYEHAPGQFRHHLLNKGRYDVTIEIGPSQDSQRESADQFLDTLVKAVPQLMMNPKVFGTFIKLKNLGPIGEQLAEDMDPQGVGQMPPQAVQQMQQQHAQLLQKVQELTTVIQSKQVEAAGHLAVEREKIAGEIKLENLRRETELAKVGMQTKGHVIETVVKHSHDSALKAHEHAHERGMQAEEHAKAEKSEELAAELAKETAAAKGSPSSRA